MSFVPPAPSTDLLHVLKSCRHTSGNLPCFLQAAAARSGRDGHLPGLLVPRLRHGRVLLLPPGGGPCGLPRADGVELHLLVAALLAAEGCVPPVHEDVAVAAQRLGAERARVQRRHAGLAERLGVEEEGGGHSEQE
jgi:hypothetical protein